MEVSAAIFFHDLDDEVAALGQGEAGQDDDAFLVGFTADHIGVAVDEEGVKGSDGLKAREASAAFFHDEEAKAIGFVIEVGVIGQMQAKEEVICPCVDAFEAKAHAVAVVKKQIDASFIGGELAAAILYRD